MESKRKDGRDNSDHDMRLVKRQRQRSSLSTGFMNSPNSHFSALPKEIILIICSSLGSAEDLFNVSLLSKELRLKCTMSSRELGRTLESIYLRKLRNDNNRFAVSKIITPIDVASTTALTASIRAAKTHFKYIPDDMCQTARNEAHSLAKIGHTDQAKEILMTLWLDKSDMPTTHAQIPTVMQLVEVCKQTGCWKDAIPILEKTWKYCTNWLRAAESSQNQF